VGVDVRPAENDFRRHCLGSRSLGLVAVLSWRSRPHIQQLHLSPWRLAVILVRPRQQIQPPKAAFLWYYCFHPVVYGVRRRKPSFPVGIRRRARACFLQREVLSKLKFFRALSAPYAFCAQFDKQRGAVLGVVQVSANNPASDQLDSPTQRELSHGWLEERKPVASHFSFAGLAGDV
jgi:hypothetical protein